MSTLERLFSELFTASVAPSDLARAGAAALARLLASDAYGGAKLVGCSRRDDGAEILVVDANLALGQRVPVNDVRPTERLAIAFFRDDLLAQVYPLRDDFPEVPHLNLSREGEPRSLCLFEMPADEALRIATPHVLIERARHWLVETAHGRLHGVDQPLDPVFGSSLHTVVLPPGSVGAGEILRGFKRSEQTDFPIILERPAGPVPGRAKGLPEFACLVAVTPALPHGRLRALPTTALGLVQAYGGLGVDLPALLRGVIAGWIRDGRAGGLADKPTLLVIATPVERTPGDVEGVAIKGFFTEATAGELGEALGGMSKAPKELGMGLLIGAPRVDDAKLAGMGIEPVDVHNGFDRALARKASGRPDDENILDVALVGAGALGSQVALDAARGGSGRWSVIDDDHLMPHNLARHGLGPEHVGMPKAEALAFEIRALLGQDAAEAVVADVRALADGRDPLGSAGLVVDASASVPVGRWLGCRSAHAASTASIFLNPSGTDLVVLREGPRREPRLDHLEAVYHWALASEPALAGHLATADSMMPSGGCRNPSVTMAQPDVAIAAALAVDELFNRPAPAEGSFTIWRKAENGRVRLSAPGERFVEVELGGWTIATNLAVLGGAAAARAEAAPLETGGILVGGWDRQLRRAWVVAHLDPPPDSESSRTGFVRGLVGVHRTLEHIHATTAVNLTYVGEWHTHPPGHCSSPSEDDRLLMRWIGEIVSFSDVPPLMLIAGEDGVRLMLGSVGCAALITPGEPPGSAGGKGTVAGSSVHGENFPGSRPEQ